MTTQTSSSASSGIGFTGLLTVAFIVLKLVPGNPVNDWTWLWVLSPLWIGLLLAFSIVGLFLLSVLLISLWERKNV